ncbi:TOM1-like protein 3 [Typha latifolia]|uniref:TOM1-like protein 3 n=1 Tax=Typha latifolia TaxID=4733 RepID=UPI003C2D70E8
MAAVACAERATSDMLIGPDWAINIELCDILNMDPGQAKDVIKLLKKRLGNKNPKVQILTLVVLEALSKNCGDTIHQQIVDRDILHEMVKIVKKKPDLNVKEKILTLLDTWQDAFGGAGGKYPQYHAAYQELRAAGVVFPPRTENTASLFTPPQSRPISYQPSASTYEDIALQASLQSDSPALSLHDIQNARGIADVLGEMLNALDQKNPESVRQEVIVDLVEQCHSYQKRVMDLVTSTGDEELLFQGLALNDDLQRVLNRHDDIAKETPAGGTTEAPSSPFVNVNQVTLVTGGTAVASVPALVNVNHEDDELEDDSSLLSRRTARDSTTGQGRKSSIAKNGRAYTSTLLPPPPASKNPVGSEAGPVDYLSGDTFKSEKLSDASINPPSAPNLSVPSPPKNDSLPSSTFYSLPKYDEPVQTVKSTTDDTPKAPWETQPSGFLPPPPSKYGQRQQFFEQQHGVSSGITGGASDGLVAETQNLSLNQGSNDQNKGIPHHVDGLDSSPTNRQTKPEDSLFKDLVDFAKAKASPSKQPSSRRTR